jgi:hypothetical protein
VADTFHVMLVDCPTKHMALPLAASHLSCDGQGFKCFESGSLSHSYIPPLLANSSLFSAFRQLHRRLALCVTDTMEMRSWTTPRYELLDSLFINALSLGARISLGPKLAPLLSFVTGGASTGTLIFFDSSCIAHI